MDHMMQLSPWVQIAIVLATAYCFGKLIELLRHMWTTW
jgi:hypothetical protein